MALEILNLGKELRHKEDPKTGLPLEKEPMEWREITEVRATGKDVAALKDEFKDVSQVHLQQAWNRRQINGEETLSGPTGRRVAVEGSVVEKYKQRGYGRLALRPSFVVNGFGGMRQAGLRHATYRYSNGQRETIVEE